MQPSVDETFAEQMRLLREARGWSQGELARRMVEAGFSNYSQMTVSRTEKGERPIRLAEARELAWILNTTVEEMVGEQDAEIVRRALLAARDELRAARDAFRVAEKRWMNAGPMAGKALRLSERPRSRGDERVEYEIDLLLNEVKQLVRNPPGVVGHVARAKQDAQRDGRGVTAAQLELAERDLLDREDHGEHKAEV